jgi:hypothetical protein
VLPVTEHTRIVSKKMPSSRLLLGHLLRPAREPEAAELVVGRARGDRIRPAAAPLDVGQRLLPALLEADPELRLHEPYVRAHDAAELDVAHAVVDHVGPVHPALLHEHAAEPGARGGRRHLPRVVRLHAADRHQRVAALGERVGHQVLELARLVAAVGEAAVAVVALRPQPGPSEVRGEPVEGMDRRGAEHERMAGERVEAHAHTLRV